LILVPLVLPVRLILIALILAIGPAARGHTVA
jgi:hypothetical protein